MLFPTLQNLEEFNNWLKQSKLNQDMFQEQLSENLQSQSKLDMSIESMEWLGIWLCNRYPNLNIENQEESLKMIDGIGRYVGETFIKHFGGIWIVEFEPPYLAFRGYPRISDYEKGYSLLPRVVYPRTWVTAAIVRNDTKFIWNCFLGYAKEIGH